MFGHQNDQNDNIDSASTDGQAPLLQNNPPVNEPVTTPDPAPPPTPDIPLPTPSGGGDMPETEVTPTITSQIALDERPDNDTPDTPTAAPSAAPSNELMDIKQQALQQLTPLMGHLDQTPEEKFRTTMMMIQAGDDQSLIPTAYEAAQRITDEKIRAQALLDVVNEINYFTQHDNA